MAAIRLSALTATRWRRVALVVLALVVLYALVGFFVVPRVVRSRLPDIAAGQKMQAGVGELRFNPFLFKVDARELRLATAAGQPLAHAGSLLVDFEPWASLFRRAWTFDAIRVDALTLDVDIAKDGSINWATIGSDAPPDAEPAGALPRVVVRNAAVRGQLRLADASGPAPAQASLTALEIDLADVATLPDREGRYEIEARLPAGGTLGWQGTLSLQPLHSAGTLRIDGLKAATLWPFVLEYFSLREPQGTLAASTRYEVSRAGGATQLALADARLRVDRLALTRDGADAPLAELATIEASGGRVDLARREVAFAALVLREGRVATHVDADGGIDWQAALTPRSAAARAPTVPAKAAPSAGQRRAVQAGPAAAAASAPAASSATAPAAAPWRIALDALRIEQVALHAVDRSRQAPLAVDVAALAASARIAVEAGGAQTAVRASDIAVTLDGIGLGAAGTTQRPVAMKSLAVHGGSVDVAARRITAQRVEARGERLDVERAADGSLALQRLFAPARAAAAAGTAARADGGAPWHAAIERVQLTGWPFSYTDRGLQPALAVRGEVVEAAAQQVDSSGKEPAQLAARLRVGDKGTLDAKATIRNLGADTQGELRVDSLALAPLQPLLARHTLLTLESGTLSASAKLSVATAGDKPPVVRASGDAGVADLLVNEADTRDRFVSWKSLKAAGISYDGARSRLAIRQIDIDEPGAKIVIFENREVNLARVMRPAAGDSSGKPAADARPEATAETRADARRDAGAEPALRTRIGRVVMQRGVVDFADLSLALPFSTRIVNFRGSVVDIASDPDRRSQVQAAGEIEPFGSARVEGALQPFDPKRFLDLKVVFTNVEMPPFSPYAVTFAGRRIADGKLWLDLEYKIADGQLAGDNKIRLADFKLGERVESKGAFDLPLDLAVALLTDEEGRIDLAVPVRGDVGDPKFDIGALVVQAVFNVIKRIVTAPFRAIGRLLGGGNDAAVAQIDFEPGSAAIRPEVRERLQAVASAINKRPQLKIVVPAPYDEQADGRALRERRVRVELAKALGEQPPPEGDELPPLAYGSRSTQRELARLYGQYAGEEAARKMLERADAAAAAPAAPPASGPAAGGGGRGAAREARAQIYEEMYERSIAAAPLDAGALAALAGQRARAVRELLVGPGAVPGERVEVGAPQRLEPGAAAAPADTEGTTTTARPATPPRPAGGAGSRAPGTQDLVGTTLQLQPVGKAS